MFLNLLTFFLSGSSTPSNDTTYRLVTNEIIEEAFDIIGVGAEGEIITANMYKRARRTLNLMILSWNAQEDLWRHEIQSIAMIADQAAYTLPIKAMRVRAVRRKNVTGGYETPMTEWSRQEYFDQPNKVQSPSTPVNFYYDPQRDAGTLYVWPAPSAAVYPTITVEIDALRPMFVMSNSNDTLDFPEEWQETVIYNLAARLKLKYPVNDPSLASEIDGRAEMLFNKLKGWDNEPASIYLQPDDRWG